jgi:hypothetical protein
MEDDLGDGSTVYNCGFAVLQGRRVVGRFMRRIVEPGEEFKQFCAACGNVGDLSFNDFAGLILWIVMRKHGRVGFERYNECDTAERKVAPPPRAIGSSSGKTDAGGEGAIEF